MESSIDPPYPPPKYVMLSEKQGSVRPPPYWRNVPRYESKRTSGLTNWLRCICCCYCCLFLFIIIILALTFALYTIYNPKIPSYKIDSFNVHAFSVQSDMSLFTEFALTVKAENPNEHIGFIYGKSSQIIVSYSDSTLCSGNLPAFYQPRKNTSMINVVLKGNSPFGSGLPQALMENRHTGRIPLLVLVKVPINVVLGNIPLRDVDVYVNCSLVIDNLSPNKKVQILSAKYDYNFAFNWY